jgi:hypothetical protein
LEVTGAVSDQRVDEGAGDGSDPFLEHRVTRFEEAAIHDEAQPPVDVAVGADDETALRRSRPLSRSASAAHSTGRATIVAIASEENVTSSCMT